MPWWASAGVALASHDDRGLVGSAMAVIEVVWGIGKAGRIPASSGRGHGHWGMRRDVHIVALRTVAARALRQGPRIGIKIISHELDYIHIAFTLDVSAH